MDRTKIEWSDATWNPVRGCSRVSEGCRFCYAEAVAARFSGPGMPYEGLARMSSRGPRWTGAVRTVPERLVDPLRWRRPRRVFVNSMSDLFHEALSDAQIDEVFAVMALASSHQFQVLTKRPARMRAYLSALDVAERVARAAMLIRPRRREDDDRVLDEISTNVLWGARLGGGFEARGFHRWPLPQVWVGVSVENQATADERIPLLLETPAAVRFLSVEPLLGP
jgi:protein gp37